MMSAPVEQQEFLITGASPFTVHDSGRVTAAAGDYWLGDPCYGFTGDHDRWMELLGSCEYFEKPVGVVGDLHVLAFATHHGDGVYDSCVGDIGVDAGVIGLMPATGDGLDHRGTHLVRFDTDVECFSKEGVLHFGHISIDTDPRFDEEPEDGPDSDKDDEADNGHSHLP